jgi:hypothetical protein
MAKDVVQRQRVCLPRARSWVQSNGTGKQAKAKIKFLSHILCIQKEGALFSK